MNKCRFGIAIYIMLLLASTGSARAAVRDNISIEPFSENLSLVPSQASASTIIKLTNNSSVARTFQVNTVDFGSLDETGGLILLGENATALQKKYGLTKWLTVASPSIQVPARQTANISILVINRDDLAPGGHYGAVVFTETDSSPATGEVGVRQAISTLLFVQKLGGEKYGLTLENVSRDNSWWQTLELKLHFHNAGNIDVIPRGVVTLIDPLGKVVARGIVNDGSSRVFPEAKRSYTVDLNTISASIIPGQYKIKVQYRYDGKSSFETYNTSLYYFNFWGSVLSVILLAIIIFAIRLLMNLSRNRRRRI